MTYYESIKLKEVYEKEMKKIMTKKIATFSAVFAMLVGVVFAPLSVNAGWVQDGNGWWLSEENGYPVKQWRMIDGTWYWFNESGYMQTGWEKIGNMWYYLYDNGAMATGWVNVGGTWYYLYDNGVMASDVSIGGCYVDDSGRWITPMEFFTGHCGIRWKHDYLKWEELGANGNRYQKMIKALVEELEPGILKEFDHGIFVFTMTRRVANDDTLINGLNTSNQWYRLHFEGPWATIDGDRAVCIEMDLKCQDGTTLTFTNKSMFQ